MTMGKCKQAGKKIMTIIVLCRCVPSADHDHDDNVDGSLCVH